MRKIFTLFILLLLLPVTVGAAENDKPSSLYVGNTDVTKTEYSDNAAYWTSSDGGTTWTPQTDKPTADSYIHYDGNGTLTLNGATIKGDNSATGVPYGTGIHAFCGSGQSVSLTIELIGENTIKGRYGILVDAQQRNTEGIDASLIIKGDSGSESSLNVTGSSNYGISVISGTGDASLTIENTTVNASASVGNVAGVCVRSGSQASNSPQLSLAVNGGSLTASGGGNNDGIQFYVGALEATNATTSLIVTDNAIVDAKNGGISAKQVSNPINTDISATGSNGGIVFDGKNGTVYGNVTLPGNLTIETGNTFTIPAGSTLDLGNHTLTNNGTLNIANQSSLTGSGTLAGNGIFTLTNPDPVISGSKTLTYDGTDQFSKLSLTAPTGTVEVMGQDFTISGSASLEGWSLDTQEIINAGTYTVTASNGTSTIEKKVTVEPAEICIASATVQDKTYNGDTDAIVESVTFNGDVQPTANDYTVTAAFDNKDAGDSQRVTVTVNLKEGGNYTFAYNEKKATVTAIGTISPLPVTLTWSTPTTFTYDGNLKTVIATVTNLVVGDEITLTYEGYTGTAVSSYTAKVIWLSGIDANNYTLDGATGTEQVWSIVGVPIADATVELGEDEFTYTGSKQKPEVTAVTLDGKALTANTDYTVTFGDNSTDAGTYTVTVTGTGNYSGTATATYTISPTTLAITGATLAFKTYDGTTNATVESVTFSGLVNSESLSMDTDYTATAVFSDANAGTGKSATVTVTLSNGNYSLATSTYTLENQTIARAVFGGTTEISGSVLANCSDEVKLPDIPDGASYGTPTSNDVTDMSITDGVLHYTGGSSVTSGGTYTITVPVTGATNYLDYNITVTLTGKKIVTVEAVGSENPSFSTSQDRFTLTATIRVDDGSLAPTTNSWTWDVADDDVVALSGSPTLRNVSVSSSDQTFEIKGPGTTTITATYDDGTYRGSVDFTVRISKPTPPDPISYYNIYVEDVCDGVEVIPNKRVVREGSSITVSVEKDTAHYTFDNFKVYYKRSYYGTWEELKEGVQPGEYPIRNIWTHIYIKAEGAEEKEDPTGIESIEGVKVYTKDGSLYVQTPQREQVIIVSMSGAVVKNEEQIGLKQYHGLQPGIYIVRVGDRAYKLRLN